ERLSPSTAWIIYAVMPALVRPRADELRRIDTRHCSRSERRRVAGLHVLEDKMKTWLAGTSPAMATTMKCHGRLCNECRCQSEYEICRSHRPRRPRRWRPGDGQSRLRLHRPRVLQWNHRDRRA